MSKGEDMAGQEVDSRAAFDQVMAKAEQEEVSEEHSDDDEEQQEAPEVSKIEKRARDMGWKPKDEYEGNPDNWRDAEEYLLRGFDVFQGKLDKSEQEARRLQQEHSLTRSIMEELRSRLDTMEIKGAESEIELLEREIDDATAEGDVEKARDLRKRLISVSQKPQKVEQKRQPADPDQDPLFIDWHASNDWYGKDPVATAYANSVAQSGKYQNLGNSRAFYDAIAKDVKEQLPERFEVKKKKVPPADGVEGATIGRVRQGGPSISDLPQEDRELLEFFHKKTGADPKELLQSALKRQAAR